MTTLLSMAFILMAELSVEPSKTEEFLSFIGEEITASRSFEGNERFEILIDTSTPGKIVFFEQWESQASRERYWLWRESRGDKEKLQKYLLAPPVIRTFEKAM